MINNQNNNKLHKLTEKERQKLKSDFLNSRIGKWLIKHKKLIHNILSLGFGIAFLILTVGTFIPNTWSISIPFPLSLFMGNYYHGFTQYYLSSNILEVIVGTTVSTHHITDIMCMWISYWIMVLITKSFIWPMIFVVTIIGIHEYAWWITYWFGKFSFLIAYKLFLSYISKLSILYSTGIFLYIILKGWNIKDFKWLVIGIIMFNIVWNLIGFPVTVGYKGPTEYITNISVYLIEESSWIFAFATFFIIVPFNKIKHRII